MKTKMFYLMMLMATLMSCSKDDGGGTQPAPENRGPEDFGLTTIADQAMDISLLPNFTWEEAVDPDGDSLTYSFYLGPNPVDMEELAIGLTETSFVMEERLGLYKDYFWRVTALDGNGGKTESKIFSFTTRKLKDAVQATPSTGFGASTEIHTTVFDGKLWAIGGNVGNTVYDEVWNTTDGTTWTQVNANIGPIYYHEALTYDGKMWALCGHNGGNAQNRVYRSNDGISWDYPFQPTSPNNRYDHTALVFDGKMWLIGGTDSGNSADYKNDVEYATDDEPWSTATQNAGFSPRRGHTSVVFDGKIWVIGGQDASGYLNDVWYSSNGIDWTEATPNADFPARSQHLSEVFGGKMWVLSGDGANGELNDVWYSTDGINWDKAFDNAAFTPRRFAASAVFDDKIWIIGGYDGNYLDDVWYME